MNVMFKIASFGWILSPFVFAGLRLSDKFFGYGINIENQNSTIFLVLCGISYVALFLNSGDIK